MTPNQTRANFQQYDVVAERGGFVDMENTRFVWARTFPTLFYPTYYMGQWVIHHDISGYHDARDKHFLYSCSIAHINSFIKHCRYIIA